MMTGHVTSDGEIALTLPLADPHVPAIEAVVDTGFNGELTLPDIVLQSIGAIPAGMRTVQLADGNFVVMNEYIVRLLWHGRPRDVVAMEAESTPLVGMELLWGCRVTFEVQDQGPMVIEEISMTPIP